MSTNLVLIAATIQHDVPVLALFFKSLLQLRQENIPCHFLFVSDPADRQIQRSLEQFKQQRPQTKIVSWRHDLTADLKDQIIAYTLDQSYSALMLVDSNLLLHPATLTCLSQANKELIASIHWMKGEKEGVEWPQVWMSDVYSFVRPSFELSVDSEQKKRMTTVFLAQLRIPGIYEVGGVSGCMLIQRSALIKGLCFRHLTNLSFPDESRHFSIRAAALGIPLYVDTRHPAYRIHRQEELEGGDLYLSKTLNASSDYGISISLCMIVRDEEHTLGRCLDSVQGIVDEIVIVDTGSCDATKQVAMRYDAIIRDFTWIDDFAEARNYAFSQAKSDYILWLDADDVITSSDREKFITLKRILPTDIDSVSMPYHLSFEADGTPAVYLRRNRLVKRERQFQWIGAVHEFLNVNGKTLHSDIAITHRKEKAYTDRNLRIYQRKQAEGAAFTARDQYYYANELRDHSRYEQAIEQYLSFLADDTGWAEDKIWACFKLADCYANLLDTARQKQALLRSLKYGPIRAEYCCRMGAVCLAENNWHQAIIWYKAASQLKDRPSGGAIVEEPAWTWLPFLQLGLCYYNLGQLNEARYYNDKALLFQPNHPSMLHNKRFFLSLATNPLS